jgi:2-dehydropantoate 2-reductase
MMQHWRGPLLTKLCSKSSSKIALSQSRFKSTSTKNVGRIHVLGAGNLGRLYAHALASSPNPPPISLLLSSQRQLKEWEDAGRKISITTNGQISPTTNYEVQVASEDSQEELIENLILCTKTLSVVEAISTIKHRLSLTSTILFTQNGMGTTEKVLNLLEEEFGMKPESLTAIASHGVYSTAPFASVHAGLGNITIGKTIDDDRSNSDYLLNLFTNNPTLNATSVSSKEIRLLQLEKLAVNSAINPVTAIFNCLNGDLSGELWAKSSAKVGAEKGIGVGLRRLSSKAPVQILARILADEAGKAIIAAYGKSMTEQEIERFSEINLKKLVDRTAEKTAKNQSSMLQDVRAGRKTEVDYINGAIVKMGNQFGVDTTAHERVIELLKAGKFLEPTHKLIFSIISKKATAETTSIMKTSPTKWSREKWAALMLAVLSYYMLLPYLPF